jgi:hypothetical protein
MGSFGKKSDLVGFTLLLPSFTFGARAPRASLERELFHVRRIHPIGAFREAIFCGLPGVVLF